MARAVVAVVGRPNVGKSSLFNFLAGSRLAIVDDQPGVTRDRLYASTDWRGRQFTLIDTGGIEPESDDHILRSMREQAEIAIETGDVILFMVDIKSGLVAADMDIANMLRQAHKPVVVVVNKVDQPGELPPEFYEFYQLGFEQVLAVSASHALGIGEMLDALVEAMPPAEDEEAETEAIRVALIGKPNAGKSSLLNRLLGENRSIVSDVAGTTRDSVDSACEVDGQPYIFIDTAGIRRRSRVDNRLEKYAVLRAVAAIERADVCLILIDAAEGITEQDTKIAGLAHNAGKASIFVLNKWDIVEKDHLTTKRYEEEIRRRFAYMSYAPVLFISALTGQRCVRLFEMIKHVYAEASKRIPTGVLNDVIGEIQAITPAPQYKGKRLKIAYATQVAVRPPLFALFVNSKDLLHFSYERHLENELRRQFGFEGSPIKLSLRAKEAKE